MKVTVEMSEQEFSDFQIWRNNEAYYLQELAKIRGRLTYIAQTVMYAVEEIPSKRGKFKIVNHDHMDDLFMLAHDVLTGNDVLPKAMDTRWLIWQMKSG